MIKLTNILTKLGWLQP